ncbi:MAG: diacylglycerol kinase family protein [Patescibacteria group bacterium]
MLEKKLHNVRYAIKGIRIAWREEISFRLQSFAAVLVSLLGWLFDITAIEWIAVILTMGSVLSAEAFNTALEELCDKYKSGHDPHIGKIKDLAAASVLIASFAALIVGAIIFLPRISLIGLTQMDAVRGAQTKYHEAYYAYVE